MRILLTGGSGQFGRAFLAACTDHPVTAPAHGELRIEDPDDCQSAVARIRPDWVIHAAAMTDVDGCERDPARALAVNATASGHLARAAARQGSRMMLISTDYVFDGSKGRYVEDDAPNPLSVYGRTKLAAERLVLDALPDAVVARTSVVFGPHKNNFVQWARRALRAGQPVAAARDQWVTPTAAADLARQAMALLGADARGTYHTAGRERLSRVEMAQRIAAHDGLDAKPIVPVSMDDLPWLARRPRDASLETTKVSRLCRPMGFDEALDSLGPLEARV